MTPSQIETAARRRLNADSSTFWASAEIIENYLYEACLILSRECRVIETQYTATSVANQSEYFKPSRAIEIYRITYNSVKLQPIGFREYDSLNNSAQVGIQKGTPSYYFLFDDVINLFPVPDTAGKTIKIFSIDEHATVTSTSSLEIPTVYHPALIDYVAYLMAIKDSDPRASVYKQNWESELVKINRHMKRRKVGDNFRIVNREEDLQQTWYKGIV